MKERIVCTGKLDCRCPVCFDPNVDPRIFQAVKEWEAYGFLMDARNYWEAASPPFQALTEIAQRYKSHYDYAAEKYGKENILRIAKEREQIVRHALAHQQGRNKT